MLMRNPGKTHKLANYDRQQFGVKYKKLLQDNEMDVPSEQVRHWEIPLEYVRGGNLLSPWSSLGPLSAV